MTNCIIKGLSPQDQGALSFYKTIAVLNEDHGVYVVQNIENNRIYIRKESEKHNISVFRYLKENPVRNTPYIYEVFEGDDRAVVIEEYISGNTLQFLIDNVDITEQTAIDLFMQLCRIVKNLHELPTPIIHRDIKPGNIIVSEMMELSLLDMDAAKWYTPGKAEDTVLLGTPEYAAPEQYGFSTSSVQTDIFALGVVLNMMVVKDYPKNRRAEGKIGKIVEKCTQIDPDKRYSSVQEILDELEGNSTSGTGREEYPFYLLPGMRSKKMWLALPSLLGYAALIWLSSFFGTYSFTGVYGVVYNIARALLVLIIPLFLGNYMNIWERLKLNEIKKLPLRILATFFTGLLLFLIGILIFSGIESLLVTINNGALWAGVWNG